MAIFHKVWRLLVGADSLITPANAIFPSLQLSQPFKLVSKMRRVIRNSAQDTPQLPINLSRGPFQWLYRRVVSPSLTPKVPQEKQRARHPQSAQRSADDATPSQKIVSPSSPPAAQDYRPPKEKRAAPPSTAARKHTFPPRSRHDTAPPARSIEINNLVDETVRGRRQDGNGLAVIIARNRQPPDGPCALGVHILCVKGIPKSRWRLSSAAPEVYGPRPALPPSIPRRPASNVPRPTTRH